MGSSILFFGCVKPIPPLENRLLKPGEMECTCKQLPDLTHFLLTGDELWQRNINLINECYEHGLLQPEAK